MRSTINYVNYAPRRSENVRKDWNRNQNAVRYKSEIKLGPVTHTVFVALMITVLGLIYLTQAAKITSYDYESEQINTRISELSNIKNDLEVENARLTALHNIEGSGVASTMVEPTDVKYVRE